MEPGELVEVDVGVAELEEAACEAQLEALEADARALLAHLGIAPAVLSVLLCSDAFIRPLNAEWRGKDAPTDVLSFSQREGEGARSDDPVLGDLVISLDTASRQAAALGHTVESELRVLLVHGLLHLLGLDHEAGPAEAAEMEAREIELLGLLGEPRPSLLRRARVPAEGAG